MGRLTELIDFINKEKPDERKYDYLTINQDLVQVRYDYRKSRNIKDKKKRKQLIYITC